NVVRHLQRQASGRVRAELEERGLAEPAATELGQILARGVGQRQVASDLGIGGFGRRECLGYGAELEESAISDGFSSGGIRYSVIEDAGSAARDQTDRHAWNPILLQHRPYCGIHRS